MRGGGVHSRHYYPARRPIYDNDHRIDNRASHRWRGAQQDDPADRRRDNLEVVIGELNQWLTQIPGRPTKAGSSIPILQHSESGI